MKNMIRIGSRLGIICAVAAIVLALVNSITAPKIAAYQEQAVQEALRRVSNGYEIGQQQPSTQEGVNYYYPLLDNEQTVGYVMNLAASGYSGPMNLLASFNTQGEILGVKLLENGETPGLGKEAEKDSYMEKFLGTGDTKSIPLRKSDLDDEDAEEVSGASITFGGIAKALEAGSLFAKELGGSR